MKKIVYSIVIPMLLSVTAHASKKDIKVITDNEIINSITNDLPKKDKIKEFLIRLVNNKDALKEVIYRNNYNKGIVELYEKIKHLRKNDNSKVNQKIKSIIKQKYNSKIVLYFTKSELLLKLFINKIKSMTEKGKINIYHALQSAVKIINRNRITTGIAITSTGLIISGGIVYSEEIATKLSDADELIIDFIDSIINKIGNNFDQWLKFWEENKYDLFPKEL